MRLRVLENKKGVEVVKKWEDWVQGENGKNWAAVITGPDKKFKLARRFLDKERHGREKFYKADEFVPGQYYQMRSAIKRLYEDDEIKFDGYFKCISRDDKFVKFESVDFEDVLEAMETPEKLKEDLAINYLNLAVDAVGKEKALILLKEL